MKIAVPQKEGWRNEPWREGVSRRWMPRLDRRMAWDRICRLLGFAGVAFLVGGAFTPLPYFLDTWITSPSQIEPADAIVVLGHSVSPSGILSPESTLRMERGIALYRQRRAPLLVFLGGANEGALSEAEVRMTLARLEGVPPGEILTETRARTTRDEATLVKALLEPRRVRSILLVTNSGHMLRARMLFERAGFEVHAAPSDTVAVIDPGRPEERLTLMRTALQELFGWVYYRIAGYL